MPAVVRTRTTGGAVAGAIAAGWVADRLLGDPVRFHPVAGFGRIAGALERRAWRPSRAVGVCYAAILVGTVAGVVAWVDHALADRTSERAAFRALVVWAALGGRSLERAAGALGAAVDGAVAALLAATRTEKHKRRARNSPRRGTGA